MSSNSLAKKVLWLVCLVFAPLVLFSMKTLLQRTRQALRECVRRKLS